MVSFLVKDGLFDGWLSLTPQLFSIFLTFVIICTFCITYNVKIRNHDENKELSGFLVITEMFVSKVEGIVISVMGKEHRKLTPYIMYIFMYIVISSIVALFGFEPLTTSYTTTLSLAFVTFIGIYYFGIRYQKLAFFKKYLNPVELVGQFVPLISLSFRLFGNMLGGSVILALLYTALINFQGSFAGGSESVSQSIIGDWTTQYKYFWSGLNIFTIILMPWLHLYFDLFDGVIQSIVFSMLTLSYWSSAAHGESEEE
ncbi:F0F1 ATP synthase subunit A [Spiroplasma turonicum]|uniref:F0F1 ATP synthase subunit A n=1 Tax=Spiroplasma turonicum TaxID=216946 RepID=A0A0K1P4S4_9MOLU|nr:F0F1 ATP synthase subunit A [Spiroplasma turonicum]AKU79291.1 F0F1 ATP synthase subunit A [Spiroplasma turonicum]ALX70314.1 F0F1 ATP synthase subunit A [Spiroplasma turonicum]